MRVLVTGATGFVGRALCKTLIQAGHDVSAAVRNPNAADIPEGVTPHGIGDIGPDTDWSKALAGADAVIHLAARAHMVDESIADAAAQFNRVNAEGTAHLAEAAANAGIDRFVYLSTVKVMGEGGGEGGGEGAPYRETDAPRPEGAYGESKLAGEKALTEVAANTSLEPVILRPPLVYGPGAKANFLTLLKICQMAPPLPFSAVRNKRSLIYLGNLVDAVILCLGAEQAAGETYFVCDDEALSTPELLRHVAQALGRPARLFPVPKALLRLAGAITGKSEAISILLSDLQVEKEKIHRQLGWNPPFNVVQGLKITADWFKTGKSP